MKAIAFEIPQELDTSLRVQVDKGLRFYDKLHYHQEIQITAILEGEGFMLVGNNFTQFAAGDIFILGSDVPHMLKSTLVPSTEKDIQAHAVSLFFTEFSFGAGFFELPELIDAAKLLRKSKQGIKILEGDVNKVLFNQLSKCVALQGLHLMSEFLSILHNLVNSRKELINPTVTAEFYDQSDRKQWSKVFTHISTQMHEHMSLESVAKVANLSVSQFSLKFKERTQKTFVQYLNEFRIESACSSLNYTDFTIEKIAFDCGFRNLSNFNRQFRKIKLCTPKEYRKKI